MIPKSFCIALLIVAVAQGVAVAYLVTLFMEFLT